MTVKNDVTIYFSGHSDDTAQCYWDGGDIDSDDCGAGSLRVFYVRAGEHRVAVNMVYGASSMWSVGIGPVDDDDELPPWPMRWRFERYTAALEIDVPVGAEVALVNNFPVEKRVPSTRDSVRWVQCTVPSRTDASVNDVSENRIRVPERADVLAIISAAQAGGPGTTVLIPSMSSVTIKDCDAGARWLGIRGVQFVKGTCVGRCWACRRRLSADDDGDADVCPHEDCGETQGSDPGTP